MTSPSPRRLPTINDLLETPTLRRLVHRVSHHTVVTGVRRRLDDLRRQANKTLGELPLPAVSELAEEIARRVLQETGPVLRPVINASGVLLSPGLGGAPLSQAAIEESAAIASNYTSLELDIETGIRVPRESVVEGLLCELSGAEAALVVTSESAATLLAFTALAGGRHIVLPRAEAIEFGGLRLTDAARLAGVCVAEIGTTNRTLSGDYESALTPDTALLVRAETAQFRLEGAAERVTTAELCQLAARRNLPLLQLHEQVSLVDLTTCGIEGIPLLSSQVADCPGLLICGGSGVIGGPECGIIVGQRDLIARLAEHPLATTLRADKLTLAALSATLRAYRRPEQAQQEIPLLHLLDVPQENLHQRAQRLAPLMAAAPAVRSAQAVLGMAYLSEARLPHQQVPAWCVALEPDSGDATTLADRLRRALPSVVATVSEDRVLINLRTVFARQDTSLVEAVESA